MTPELFWIDGPWPGRLAIAPRPRGGDWLADEVERWKSAEVSKVISTLTALEAAELELEEEKGECVRQELSYDSFPIEDRGVPDMAPTIEKLHGWERELEMGKTLIVHCRQGVGRSSLLAASLLALSGQSAVEAWKKIEIARGRPVPDTDEQKRWVDRLLRSAAASH